MQNYRGQAFISKVSYMWSIGLKFLVLRIYGQCKLWIILPNFIEPKSRLQLQGLEKKAGNIKDEIKKLTNVYSWPQYILVSSDNDVIFLREDNICNTELILGKWNKTHYRRIKYLTWHHGKNIAKLHISNMFRNPHLIFKNKSCRQIVFDKA